MKSKSTLTFIINGAFLFILLYSCYQFYINSRIYFELPSDIERSKFLGTLYYISAFTIIGILFSIIHFNTTVRKWNDANFFDLKTVKKFEIQGVILLTIGATLFVMEFATLTMPFREYLPSGFLGMGVSGGAMLFCIGLLFSLVASIIAIAKRLKDENDLTI